MHFDTSDWFASNRVSGSRISPVRKERYSQSALPSLFAPFPPSHVDGDIPLTQFPLQLAPEVRGRPSPLKTFRRNCLGAPVACHRATRSKRPVQIKRRSAVFKGIHVPELDHGSGWDQKRSLEVRRRLLFSPHCVLEIAT